MVAKREIGLKNEFLRSGRACFVVYDTVYVSRSRPKNMLFLCFCFTLFSYEYFPIIILGDFT